MTPQEKYAEIEALIRQHISAMQIMRQEILDQDVSHYPIFVFHRNTIDIGIPFIYANETQKWAVHVSTLEEFYTKGLILEERVAAFRSLYKTNPDKYCCFVLSDMGADFVFVR